MHCLMCRCHLMNVSSLNVSQVSTARHTLPNHHFPLLHSTLRSYISNLLYQQVANVPEETNMSLPGNIKASPLNSTPSLMSLPLPHPPHPHPRPLQIPRPSRHHSRISALFWTLYRKPGPPSWPASGRPSTHP